MAGSAVILCRALRITRLPESANLSFGWTSRCEDEILAHKSCCAPPHPTGL